jgi:hypothetical protein
MVSWYSRVADSGIRAGYPALNRSSSAPSFWVIAHHGADVPAHHVSPRGRRRYGSTRMSCYSCLRRPLAVGMAQAWLEMCR